MTIERNQKGDDMGIARCDNMSELLPLVDEEGNVTGSATRGECHSGSKLLHPVVHLHVYDPDGRLYLQRRPDWKDIQPGKWDTAVGGHIDLGETVEEALVREVREELGLDISDESGEGASVERLCRYVFESDRERELINVYRLTTDKTPMPSAELDGGRFWTNDEILEALGKGVFTPNFENEFEMICRLK